MFRMAKMCAVSVLGLAVLTFHGCGDSGSGSSASTAYRLNFVVQPSGTPVDTVISPAVQVEIVDASGNRVTSAGGTISLTLIGFAGSTLGGTTSVTASSGVATFDDLTVDTPETGYRLVAKSGTLYPAVSDYFTIGNKLVFTVQPQDTVAGYTMPTVEVTIQDGAGATVTGATDNIMLTLVDSTATLYGTVSVSATAGVAQFNSLYMEEAGAGYTLQAIAAGLVSGTSTSFAILADDISDGLKFITQPSDTMPGEVMSPPVQVAVTDEYGNVIPTATDPVTLDFDYNPSGATLGGTLTVDAVAGIATFDGLTIDRAGRNYTLNASSGSLSTATSDSFNVGFAVLLEENMDTDIEAKGWTFSEPTYSTGWEWGQPTGATCDYGADDPDSGYTGDNVLGYNLNGGYFDNMPPEYAVSPVIDCTDQHVVILSFQRWLSAESYCDHATVEVFDGSYWQTIYDGYDDGPDDGAWYLMEYDITEYAAGNPNLQIRWGMGSTDSSVTYCGWNIDDVKVIGRSSQGALDHMEFEVEPSDTAVGAVINPPVKVALKDTFGDTLLTANDTVTISIGTNPSGGTLSGTTSVAAVNGVATFNDLSIDAVGANYCLAADCATLAPIESAFFNVSNKLVFTVQPVDSEAGSYLSIEVTVQDGTGATVTSATPDITLALADDPGGTTLSGTTTVTAVSGVASFNMSYITVAAEGYTLIATAPGYGPSDKSNSFDITPSAFDAIIFGVQPTDTAPFEPFSPVVRVDAVDADNNIVPTVTGTITISLNNDPTGYAELLGATTVDIVNGSAYFTDLSIDVFGEGFTLMATDGTYTAYSDSFDARLILFQDDLSTDPTTSGWVFSHPDVTNGWAWGQPTGASSDSGNGDPDSGYTGDNCLAFNLNGDYANNMYATEYVTSPAFSCAGCSTVTLTFYGWAGFESGYDHGTVEVFDGSMWHIVYDGYDDGPDDDDWYEYEFDISSIAAGRNGVKLRWGVGPTDGSVTYQAWNVDDVVVTGTVE